MLSAAADNSDKMNAPSSARKTHMELIQHFAGHLNEAEFQYFRDWDRLIDLEALVSSKEITKCWLIQSKEREQSTGKCISSLVLDESILDNATSWKLSNFDESTVVIKLTRSECSLITTSLKSLKFELGNRVVLSTDCTIFQSEMREGSHDINSRRPHRRKVRQQMHILRGVLEQIEESHVLVRISERDAMQLVNFVRLQSLHLVHEQNEKNSTGFGNQMFKLKDFSFFRLDKDEITTGIGTLRQNLVNLFTADILPFSTSSKNSKSPINESPSMIHIALTCRMPRLRRFIVHLDRPNFDPKSAQPLFKAPPGQNVLSVTGCSFNNLAREFSSLNRDQRAAVVKVNDVCRHSNV